MPAKPGRTRFKIKQKYHDDVLDLDDGLLSGSLDRLAILCDVAFESSFLLNILARHSSLGGGKKNGFHTRTFWMRAK